MKSVPLIALLTLLAGTLTASMTDPRMPIWMSGSAINVDTLRGSGIVIAPGIESKPWPVLGGEIAWRKADDMIDPIGMRHVFYRQFYISSATKVAAQLAGAEVGIHFDKKGKLTFVGGNQFADFALANALRIERADVQAHARALVSGVAGFQLPPIVSVTTAELNALDTETRLLLASDGSSSDFRYVWTALVRDATHETYSVDMDADTGKLLRVGVRFGTNNCTPSNPTVQYSAIGIPTRTDVAASGVVRSLAVSPTSDRPAPFVYEGHMQPGYQTPAINTFQVVTDPTYLCQPQYSPDYSLFPLRDTRYDNYGDQWLGRVAGDATYFTNIAMATFRSFGVCGFDRSCATTASISVNAPPYIDNATYTTIASQYAPAWSVISAQRRLSPTR